jgi:FkbM family methyltransferase
MNTRDVALYLAKRFLPPPVKQIPWRIKWASHTKAFNQNPTKTLLRTARWTIRELENKDLKFTLNNIEFNTPSNNMIGLFAYVEGSFDESVFSFIENRLPVGGVLCDVGANIGIYTLLCSKLVGQKGKIVAFEAHPKTFSYLTGNVKASGASNIILVPSAVGSASGSVHLEWDIENSAATHVTPASNATVQVPMVTLDEELRKNGIDKLDYLKIDVEGYELSVLRGAHKIIQNSPRLLIQTEVDRNHLARFGHSGNDLKALMDSFGFEPWQIGSTGDLALRGLPDDFGEVIWMRRS